MLRSVSESMAGRVGILNLEGLTLHEMFEQPDNTWLESYFKSPETICKGSKVLSTPPLVNLLWRGSLPSMAGSAGEHFSVAGTFPLPWQYNKKSQWQAERILA